MTAKMTYNQFKKWLNESNGKQYDTDGYAAFQCFDYANAGWIELFGHSLKGEGAVNIPFDNNFKGEAVVYQNTPEFLAKTGDLVVFNNKYGGGYGHVAWVTSATLDYIWVQEQNWLGGGWTSGDIWHGTGWEKVTKRKHKYDFPMWFIRPNFKPENAKKESVEKSSPQSATKATAKKQPAAKKKMKKLSYIRDEVRGYRLPNRGYKPTSITLHNDAGSVGATAEAYHRGLVNAPLSRLEAGVAHSYISGNTVYQALPESRIAWHTANQNGNKNSYGIEICQSIGASDKMFLANEQAAFQEAARLLNKWGLKANRNTVRLHMEFSQTSCPHRSMKLHTGFDPVTQGVPSQGIKLKLKDYFIKQIRAYQAGKVPTATVSKNSSSASNTKSTVAGAWKRNSYGTWYMSEKARFTNGSQPIMVRTVGPFRSCPHAYNFQPGGWCDYTSVLLQDGHVWIEYKWKGTLYYLPIRTWNGQAPPNHGVGQLWGTIS